MCLYNHHWGMHPLRLVQNVKLSFSEYTLFHVLRFWGFICKSFVCYLFQRVGSSVVGVALRGR